MASKSSVTLVRLKYPGYQRYYILDTKSDRFVPLEESHLSRACPGYTRLNEAARQKELNSLVKRSEIIRNIRLPTFLPNADPKNIWEDLSWKEQMESLRSLLSVTTLFCSPSTGHIVLADMLCATHCTALRRAEPSFSPCIAVKSTAPDLKDALNALVKTAVCTKRWKSKHFKIKRKAILDYGNSFTRGFPHHFQDFSQLKAPISGYKPLRIPMAYNNTVALVTDANKTQTREAAPYLENAAVIFLNSDCGDLTPTKIPASSIEAYDPEVVERLRTYRHQIAAIFRWWSLFYGKKAWAEQIVQKARASFGKPDSRYIRVELDPKKLRNAIRCEVLLSFLDELEKYGLMPPEALEPYRLSAKNVFAPAPPEPVTIRHAEDPEIFLEIMRGLAAEKSDAIVPEGDRFVKADRPFGAWRTISGEHYLVLPEDAWAKAYAKAVRSRKDLDTSFFSKEGWERDLQKILAEQGLIKQASSGYRYRYNLYQNGARDQTYVLAIPSEQLKS